MVDAATIDGVREEKPYLTIGQYSEVEITRTEHAETFEDAEYFFIEGVVGSSSGKDALPAGSDFKYAIRLDVSKKATSHMVDRLRNFVGATTGKRKLNGSELLGILDDSASFVGKKAAISVAPQTDADGEPKLKDDGTPWLEVKFSALSAN